MKTRYPDGPSGVTADRSGTTKLLPDKTGDNKTKQPRRITGANALLGNDETLDNREIQSASAQLLNPSPVWPFPHRYDNITSPKYNTCLRGDCVSLRVNEKSEKRTGGGGGGCLLSFATHFYAHCTLMTFPHAANLPGYRVRRRLLSRIRSCHLSQSTSSNRGQYTVGEMRHIHLKPAVHLGQVAMQNTETSSQEETLHVKNSDGA